MACWLQDKEKRCSRIRQLCFHPAIMLGRRLLQGRQPSSLSTIAKALARSNSTVATPAPAAASNPLAAQAPNYPTTWSANQQPRPLGQSNPRFEQTAMETQPAPLSAMQLISEEPIRLVDGRKAVCDGGASLQFHPTCSILLTVLQTTSFRQRTTGASKNIYQFGESLWPAVKIG